jgi:hypothetical protein
VLGYIAGGCPFSSCERRPTDAPKISPRNASDRLCPRAEPVFSRRYYTRLTELRTQSGSSNIGLAITNAGDGHVGKL